MDDEREHFTRLVGRNNHQFSFSFNPAPIFGSGGKPQSQAGCLPYDILQEIFQYCLPESPLTTPQPNKTLPPLVLCHVSASWRVAAFEDYRLWKDLHVCLRFARRRAPYNDIAVPQKQMDMITWWTTRVPNGEYAYSFNFTHRNVLPARGLEGLYVNSREVFKIPGVRLARTVNLAMTHEQWAFVSEDSTPFNQLRSFALILTGNPGPSDLTIPLTPLLRRLEINYLRNPFPWGQLTHLNMLGEISPSSWRDPLEACTNLRSAMFRILPEYERSRSIIHPNLRQLVVQSESFIHHSLFHGLLFPSLRSLRLSVTPHLSLGWSGSETTPISLGSLHRILRSTPSLRELHLHNCINFLNANSFSGHRHLQACDPLSTFVPRLEHLVIEKLEESLVDVPQNIAALVQSQWMCANWTSPSTPETPPHCLDVEVILRSYFREHVQKAVGEFYDPNVRLTITELQNGLWVPPTSANPGALDNWDDLVKFRIPVG